MAGFHTQALTALADHHQTVGDGAVSSFPEQPPKVDRAALELDSRTTVGKTAPPQQMPLRGPLGLPHLPLGEHSDARLAVGLRPGHVFNGPVKAMRAYAPPTGPAPVDFAFQARHLAVVKAPRVLVDVHSTARVRALILCEDRYLYRPLIIGPSLGHLAPMKKKDTVCRTASEPRDQGAAVSSWSA